MGLPPLVLGDGLEKKEEVGGDNRAVTELGFATKIEHIWEC